MPFATYCPQCRSKLIPILYGRMDKEQLELEKNNRAILGGLMKKPYNSFCLLCEETYESHTDMPE